MESIIYHYRHFYKVPDDYIDRRGWTKSKPETQFIESGKKFIAQYQIDHIF